MTSPFTDIRTSITFPRNSTTSFTSVMAGLTTSRLTTHMTHCCTSNITQANTSTGAPTFAVHSFRSNGRNCSNNCQSKYWQYFCYPPKQFSSSNSIVHIQAIYHLHIQFLVFSQYLCKLYKVLFHHYTPGKF